MLKCHIEEVLDQAELDVQEDVIWKYTPWGDPKLECFAIKVYKPFEEAAGKLAEFYVALGAVAQGREMDEHSGADILDLGGWSHWKVDSFPKYGRGEEPYTIFFFPKGKVED